MLHIRFSHHTIPVIAALAYILSSNGIRSKELLQPGGSPPDIVETEVYRVRELGETEKQYIVLLRDLTAPRMLPIWIGECEARAIAAKLQKKAFPRPLTHDLFKNVLEIAEVRITSILVDQLRPISDTAPGGTYFAIITLRKADGTAVRIDARPSDAIALAVRSGLSIFVSRSILDENGIEDAPKPVDSTEPATSPPTRFYD